MTRRDVLLATGAAALAFASQQKSTLAVEGYIFQQYAQSLKKPLPEVVGQALTMARAAGFENIELNQAFFAPVMRQSVLSLLRSQNLRMPSLYVGGSMHEKNAADQTIATALEVGSLCAPFGLKAIVNNPDPKPDDAPKTDQELGVQADSLNRMGRILAQHGFAFRVHHHTPQLAQNAREWRHILKHTDPQYVRICVDVDWAYEAGFDPLPFLHEVGQRLEEVHLRSATNKVWLQDLEDSDIDYRAVAAYLHKIQLAPLLVVELAYRPATRITRPLEEDLRLSRVYAERVFRVNANA